MTSTAHPTPPGPHLDDEALSALIDGEGPPQAGEHAGRCAACGGRLEALRHAARTVGTPPPVPDDETRERAIAAALAATPTEQGGRTDLVSLAPRRRRRAPVWLVTAACLAALVVGVGLVRGVGGGDGGGDDTAATGTPSVEDQTATLEAAPTAGAGVVDGGDLGELDAHSDLREPVQTALRDGAPTAAGEGGDDLSGDGAAAGAAPEEEADPEVSPAPQRSAFDAGGGAGNTCLEEARGLDDGLGALRYRARARFDGAEAVVYAFDVDGGERMRLRVVVLETAGCEIRLVSSFNPR